MCDKLPYCSNCNEILFRTYNGVITGDKPYTICGSCYFSGEKLKYGRYTLKQQILKSCWHCKHIITSPMYYGLEDDGYEVCNNCYDSPQKLEYERTFLFQKTIIK